jgi:hypothetical protein
MRNACIVGLIGLFVALGCGSSDEETAATPTATPTPAEGADAPKKRSPEVIAAKRAEQAGNAQIAQGSLPDGFPTDLPMFPDAQPKTSMMVGNSGLVVLTSNASLSDVLTHFREQLPSQGWTVDSVSEAAGGTKATVKAHKDARTATVSLNQAKGGTGTEIGISLKGSS